MLPWMRKLLWAAFALQLCQALAAITGRAPAPVLAVASAAGASAVWAIAVSAGRQGRKAEDIIRSASVQPSRGLLSRVVTSTGETLADISDAGPTLLLFVRHAGCCFCREALSDVSKSRNRLESAGVRIVVVHQSSEGSMRRLIRKYRLQGINLVADAGGALYRAFGLRHGTLGQLFGPKVWIRGFQAAVVEKHGMGVPATDPWQMPGVFLLHKGRILARYYHRSAADRPNYAGLCEVVTTPAAKPV